MCIYLLEKCNRVPRTYYATNDLTNASSSLSISKLNQKLWLVGTAVHLHYLASGLCHLSCSLSGIVHHVPDHLDSPENIMVAHHIDNIMLTGLGE